MKTWSNTVSLRWSEQLVFNKTSMLRCHAEEDIYCSVKVSSVPFIRHLGHKPRQELTLHHRAAALLWPERIYNKALGCFTACVTKPERQAITLFY